MIHPKTEKKGTFCRILLTTLGGLFVASLLQLRYMYHLFFLEQHQLFLSGDSYAKKVCSKPGGLIEYVSEFCIQFFSINYIGSICVTAFLLSIGITLHYLLRKEKKERSSLFLFEAMVILFLGVNMLDMSFYFKGVIGFLCCLVALLIYKRLQNPVGWKRILSGTLLASVLFWMAAPFHMLFLLSATCLDLRKYGFNKGKSLFFLLLAIMSGYVAYLLLGTAAYRQYFSFESICSYQTPPDWTKYAAWIVLPAAILVTPLFRRLTDHIPQKAFVFALQLLPIAAVLFYLLPKHDDSWLLPIKQLNHYAKQEKWEDILTYCKENPSGDDYVYLNYQNLALAEKGILADSLLEYTQNGGNGLFAPWDRTVFTAFVLQDISYRYGSIASAQRFAFEGNVESVTQGYPQTMKTLVRTNLLQKQYQVAAKYIHYLQQTYSYKAWADKQVLYLTDTIAMQNGPEYKDKQVYLHLDNYLLAQNDLFTLSRLDKQNKRLRDFVLCYHLLNKDLEKFLVWFDYYYKAFETEGFPTVYYEALMACAQNHPYVLLNYKIPDEIIENFEMYTDIYSSTNDLKERKKRVSLYHAKTYWFYLHYIKISNA